MSILNLITNSVEGVAQVSIGVAKGAAGVVVAPLDDGETLKDAGENIRDGVEKVANSND